MNALILLANGFETVEALATYDVFTRSHKIHPTLCSINEHEEVTSSIGVRVQADATLDKVDVDAYQMLVLPGGKLGVENLGKDERVLRLVRAFLDSGRDVHAICAAPSILGTLGVLDGLEYTCFPGFQRGAGTWRDQGVVETPHIVTGRSMGFTLPFAKTIVAHYYGSSAVEAMAPGIDGLE